MRGCRGSSRSSSSISCHTAEIDRRERGDAREHEAQHDEGFARRVREQVPHAAPSEGVQAESDDGLEHDQRDDEAPARRGTGRRGGRELRRAFHASEDAPAQGSRARPSPPAAGSSSRCSSLRAADGHAPRRSASRRAPRA
jgi:hypothetical protein